MTDKRNMTTQPTSVVEWMEKELERDAALRREVEETLARMRIEQDLAALRERRQLSQHQVARILGVSQPAIARIESGRAKNIEIRTLVRYAVALGGRVQITIIDDTTPMRARLVHENAGRRGLRVVRGKVKTTA